MHPQRPRNIIPFTCTNRSRRARTSTMCNVQGCRRTKRKIRWLRTRIQRRNFIPMAIPYVLLSIGGYIVWRRFNKQGEKSYNKRTRQWVKFVEIQTLTQMKTRVNFLALIFVFVSYDTVAQTIWTLQSCIDHAFEHNIQIKQSELGNQRAAINPSGWSYRRIPPFY